MPYYDPITLMKAVELAKPVPSFLLETFLKPFSAAADLCPTETAEIDVRKGATRLAPFVAPRVGGVTVARDGYSTNTIKFPTLAPEMAVTQAEVAMRAFGSSIYSGATDADRANQTLAEDINNLRRMIALRMEWMAAQILCTGRMDVPVWNKEGRNDESFEVDYGFDNQLTPQALWDQDGSDPNRDMQALYEMVYEGQGQVDIIILGSAAANAFLRNETVMKQLDNRRMWMGEAAPRRYPGVRYIGMNEDGVEMYAYTEKYRDEDGAVHSFIPEGMIIAASRGMLRAMYGPVYQVGEDGKPHVYMAREVPVRFSDMDSNAVKQRVISRPMIIPENADGWATMEVLA